MAIFNIKVSLSDRDLDYEHRCGNQRREVYIREGYLKATGVGGNIRPDELALMIADRILDDVNKQPFQILEILREAKNLTPEMEEKILTERDTNYKKELAKEFDKAFGYKNIGRGKGRINNETPNYSKDEFRRHLTVAIFNLSATGESVTQADVARQLGYRNSKQLQRILDHFGERRDWRKLRQDILEKSKN